MTRKPATTWKNFTAVDQETATLLYGASLTPGQKLKLLEEMREFVLTFRPDLILSRNLRTTRKMRK